MWVEVEVPLQWKLDQLTELLVLVLQFKEVLQLYTLVQMVVEEVLMELLEVVQLLALLGQVEVVE
tara:strand:- start:348 stop:542 length:195 start_codon:yes stop_codon:yes gene_type:complete